MDENENRYSLALKQIVRSANSDLTSAKILKTIASSTAKALQTSGCAIMELNPQREHLYVIGSYGLSDIYLRKGAINAHLSYPEILEGKTVTVPDISTDKRTQYPDYASLENIQSFMGAPIVRNGDVIGEIRIYNRVKRVFKPFEKDFLGTVANLLAIFLEKSELQSSLKNYHNSNIQRLEAQAKSIFKSSSPHHISFGHPSEEEFARLLDFYQIEWVYEPRSFPLTWEDDKIKEMFTPDFYLPEINLYIELTTTKQSLITEKNRKIRRLTELYPDINIKLINKGDYVKLLTKYGFLLSGENKMSGVSQILFTRSQIQRRTKILAKQISKDYEGKELILIGVLRGVVCFMSDLMRNMSIPVLIDFMAISNPGNNPNEQIKITKDLDIDIENRDVLMVEDIVDTGMTLHYLLNYISEKKPASLKVCTLLDKSVRRLVNVPLEYVGFEIPDEFVVGYGLDFGGKYRNLPSVCILE